MPILAKIALGCAGTACAAGGWAFHDGVIRVNVDETRAGGQHLHLMIPAALIPVAARFMPQRCLQGATSEARSMLPALAVASRELGRLADAELLRVDSAEQHVRMTTEKGYIVIDVREPDNKVYVRCPLAVIREVAGELREWQPAS